MRVWHFFGVALLVAMSSACRAQEGPATRPASAAGGKVGRLPHVEFDPAHKQVRVECEALNVDAPLEFFCCVTGTNDYESVLRSAVKPSDLHLALLAIGLKPGSPVTYSEVTKQWIPAHGPPLQITVEYQDNGKTIRTPGYRMLRNTKTKKEAEPFTWVFAGSRQIEGKYAADTTGYLVSVVNFDLVVIDIPRLASSSNELLEWERNPDQVPKAGTKVTMILEPAGAVEEEDSSGGAEAAPGAGSAPATRSSGMEDRTEEGTGAAAGEGASREDHPAAGSGPATNESMSSVHADQKLLDDLRQRWQRAVQPHGAALREAAQAHYEVIAAMRREQQRLIDEADRIQRGIDELEKDYQDMTTPRPEPVGR